MAAHERADARLDNPTRVFVPIWPSCQPDSCGPLIGMTIDIGMGSTQPSEIIKIEWLVKSKTTSLSHSNKILVLGIIIMQHLCSVSPTAPLSTNNNNNNLITYGLIIRTSTLLPRRSNNNEVYQWRISSMERESSYEVDSDKAKQALSELDMQFESLSAKQLTSSKIKGSSMGSMKEVRNEPPEITGTFLGYTAFVLFLFSIFYNILFITVIKPSIDGPDEDIVANDVTTTYQVSDATQ